MSRPARPYNTALASSIPAVRAELTDTKFAFSDRGVVFAHDILEPLPEVMDRLIGSRVECLYAETPWVAGSATFYERAGLAPKPHAEYVSAVERLIEHFGKPAFIVCSKRDAAALGEAVSPIVLNGERAWLARAGGGTIEADTVETLRARLAERYAGVYDFSCGYGNALGEFSFFVGSDIDQKCLDYIRRKFRLDASGSHARDGADPQDQAVPPQRP